MANAAMTDIAVVIPCLNLGSVLREALDSVTAQTRPAAEIIVVDDGSTEPLTCQVLEHIADPGVRVYRRPHAGAAATRNYGVSQTTAPYLLFLDGDDVLEPDYLEKTGALLDGNRSLDFVSTAMRGFGDATYVWTPPNCDLETALTRGTIPITALFRRRVWDATGGFDETLPTSMDLDFWIRVMELGFQGTILDQPLLGRRVRADSLHHAAVSRGTHLGVLTRILRTHRAIIERIGPDVLLAKELFLAEQRRNREDLERRREDLSRELAALNATIAERTARLRASGFEPVDLGDFWRRTPFNPSSGLDRGTPIDRYYIEHFLDRHRADVRGRVLEVTDSSYTRAVRSTRANSVDVLPLEPGSATVIADLAAADVIASESFDCLILTHSLHTSYDVRAAVLHAHRMLKPGGVLLATFPGISWVNAQDVDIDNDYWRFTQAALLELFAGIFTPGAFHVSSRGNVQACAAFLYGMAAEELSQPELDHVDSRFPLILSVRATKRGGVRPVGTPSRGHGTAAILV